MANGALGRAANADVFLEGNMHAIRRNSPLLGSGKRSACNSELLWDCRSDDVLGAGLEACLPGLSIVCEVCSVAVHERSGMLQQLTGRDPVPYLAPPAQCRFGIWSEILPARAGLSFIVAAEVATAAAAAAADAIRCMLLTSFIGSIAASYI